MLQLKVIKHHEDDLFIGSVSEVALNMKICINKKGITDRSSNDNSDGQSN